MTASATSARGCVARAVVRTTSHRAAHVAPAAARRAASASAFDRIVAGPSLGVGGLPTAPRVRTAGPARRPVARSPEAAAAGISATGTGDGAAPQRKATGKSAVVLAVVLAALSWAGYLLTQNTVVGQAAYQALAKTGFTAAFALIFVSELSDKTFFIAALLAMRLGRFTVLTGAVCALSLMSFISVAIGKFFQQIPAAMTTTLPVGEYLAVALLLFFGVRTLKEALDIDEDGDDEDGELADAQEAVSKSAGAGNKKTGFIAGFWETFTLVFIAEWGDRSMLATIALGAAQSPLGVALGASVGHLVATLIAVVGGALLSEKISERQVGITGGILFIVFAVATLAGVF